jgi:hypothetical protein
MCDVPSTAVLCSAFFPITTYKFFFKPFFTIPVDPVITGIISHFTFHIRCFTINKILYFGFFFSFLLLDISVRIATSISRHTFSFLGLIIISIIIIIIIIIALESYDASCCFYFDDQCFLMPNLNLRSGLKHMCWSILCEATFIPTFLE